MQRKAINQVTLKDADHGEISAVFATFGVVDKDGDITDPKAFEDGAKVVISSYGHKSWDGALPIGVGHIKTTDSEAILEGQFFMDTQAGRETFTALKAMHDAGIPSEFSYGFDVLDSEPITGVKGAKRLLKRMKTFEVSPTLLGAGVNTRTLALKSAELDDSRPERFADELAAFIEEAKSVADSTSRVVALRREKGKNLSVVNAEKVKELTAVLEQLKSAIEPVEEPDTSEPEMTEAMKSLYLSFIRNSIGE